MDDLKVSEVIEKKSELERSITELVKSFEKQTGLVVNDLGMNTTTIENDSGIVLDRLITVQAYTEL